jgi:formate/nitrite transporter FocA (FNT family)
MSDQAVEDERDEKAGSSSRHLDENERDQAAAHAAPKALVIHEVLREEGESELKRPVGALFWSGLAAGMSMGFSLLTLAFLQANLPDEHMRAILGSFGYCVGFVLAVLGKQQLFTETTLTATLPLLMRRQAKTFVALMRMWAVVLVSNILGTIIFAWLISRPGLFDAPIRSALESIGTEIVSGPTLPTFVKAMLSGWLIALMVWVLPGAGSARLFVIILLTYVVALGHFPHIVAGSADAAFAVFSGHASVRDYLLGFFAPTLVGNTIGGVAFAAILNHAPIAHDIAAAPGEEAKKREPSPKS